MKSFRSPPVTAQALAAMLLMAPVALADTTFLPFGSSWRYLDDGSDQGSAWVQPPYDDSHWAEGAAELGYGEGDEATVVSFGGDPRVRFVTVYCRRTLTVADPSTVPGLTFDLLCDDGAIVYVNGAEVLRTNMPEGAATYDTLASESLAAPLEYAIESFPVDPSVLVAGANTIAVEIHQASRRDGDLSFDLRVTKNTRPTPPLLRSCQLALTSSQPFVTLSSQNISASDLTSDEAALQFTVSGVESGSFELASAPGTPITKFTQAQITGGEIRFVYKADRFGAGTSAGTLAEPFRHNEISGIVASSRDPGLLWASEDSNNPATLIALGTDGSNRGEWALANATNTDWEDIAAATVNGKPMIYIGDFGDNGAVRNNLVIYRVKEPPVTGTTGGVVPVADVEAIGIQYPDFPAGDNGVASPGIPARRDAESLIVDPGNGDMYILSKREPRCRLFRLTHQAAYLGVQTLEYLGELPALTNDFTYGFSASATGADISRDGLEVVIRNYTHIFYFRRPDLQTSLADLLTGDVIEEIPPVRFDVEPVGEAVCFSGKGDGLLTIGEIFSGATSIPLVRYRRLPPLSPPAFSVSVSDGALSDGPHPATILFDPGPLELWRHQHFAAQHLGDPNMEATLWGHPADPDSDGRTNLLEYASGSDPRSPGGDGGSGVVIARESAGPKNFLTLTYERDTTKTDIAYQVQASDDLVSWSNISDKLVNTVDGIETRKATVATNGALLRYLRLAITAEE